MVASSLQHLLSKAKDKGATFRLSGSDVLVENASTVPKSLMEELRVNRDGIRNYLSQSKSGELTSADYLAKAGVKVEIAESEVQARVLLDRVINEAGDGSIGLDMETAPKPQFADTRPIVKLTKTGAVAKVQPKDRSRSALNPHLSKVRLVQIYGGGSVCGVFDMSSVSWDILSPLWSRSLIAHNAAFELLFLRALEITPDAIECTMQAGGLMLGVGRRSLATVADEYMRWVIPKDQQTSDWSAQKLSKNQIEYAALDAVVCFLLWHRLEKDLHARSRWNAYVIQRNSIPGAVEMAWRGVGLDSVALREEIDDWSCKLGDAREKWVSGTGTAPPSTPAEIRAWLQSELTDDHLRHWPKTKKTGDLSTSKDVLGAAIGLPPIRNLVTIQSQEKLLNSFGQGLLDKVSPVTGRVHTSFNIASAKSGRWSSSRPNLQQMPGPRIAPKFRRIFRAAEGFVLVGADYSQMELRAAAEVSEDTALREIYERGLDLHTIQAAAMARVSEEAVTPDQRSRAKPVNFGSIYGMSPRGLVSAAWKGYRVVMTEAEATQALDSFFRKFPQLKTWMRDHANICKAQNQIVIGAGRVVEASWENGHLSYTKCCNLPIQGACADAMMRAVSMVHGRFHKMKIIGGLVMSVHDELIAEVHQDCSEEALHILETSMVEAFLETFPKAAVKNLVARSVGQTWSDLKS